MQWYLAKKKTNFVYKIGRFHRMKLASFKMCLTTEFT